MQDQNVNPILGVLVILAAIATTFTTYSSYNEEAVAVRYEEERANMDNAASVLLGIKAAREATNTSSSSDAEVEVESE